MIGDMVSSSDLADLTKSAQAVEDRSKELASKQAENLEQVSEELLCSPEIIRWVGACVCVCVRACVRAHVAVLSMVYFDGNCSVGQLCRNLSPDGLVMRCMLVYVWLMG